MRHIMIIRRRCRMIVSRRIRVLISMRVLHVPICRRRRMLRVLRCVSVLCFV